MDEEEEEVEVEDEEESEDEELALMRAMGLPVDFVWAKFRLIN